MASLIVICPPTGGGVGAVVLPIAHILSVRRFGMSVHVKLWDSVARDERAFHYQTPEIAQRTYDAIMSMLRERQGAKTAQDPA
jgi:hypothetical protein